MRGGLFAPTVTRGVLGQLFNAYLKSVKPIYGIALAWDENPVEEKVIAMPLFFTSAGLENKIKALEEWYKGGRVGEIP